MSLRDMFTRKQSAFVVGGVQYDGPPKKDDEITKLLLAVATELTRKLPTEQDIYWFVIEQYDNFLEYGEDITSRVEFPFSMFEIEYEGRRSESSYVGKPNPGVTFLDKEFMPPITQHFSLKQAQHWRALIFGMYCQRFQAQIAQLRLKYAVHYHNNCIKTKSYRSADKWNEVITDLGGE